jgi:hypothetical protein
LRFAQLPDLQHAHVDRQRRPVPGVVSIVSVKRWIDAHVHPRAALGSSIHELIIAAKRADRAP